MSPITKTSLMFSFLLLLFVVTLAGCGSSNSQSTFSSDTGEHPAGWLPAGHMERALVAGLDSCAQCHGANYNGGISWISCTSCHMGGVNSVHPANWGSYAYARHSDYVRSNGTGECANAWCHGTDLAGINESGPSCTLCHLGGVYSKHPIEWSSAIRSHGGYVTANPDVTCANLVCHVRNSEGEFLGGPSCDSCH